ncbi:MAG: AraC family transcriptional regulator [Pseudomonadales bacterium]
MTNLIRVGLLPYFSATIQQFGKDPEEVFKGVGIDPAGLDVADTFIPYDQYRQLLVEAVTITGCERFGLLMSKKLGPQSLGVVGFAMQQSTDVRAAFEVLARFLHLSDQHGIVTVEPEGEHFRIGYSLEDLDVPGSAQAIDVAAALGHNILKTLVGHDVKAIRYEFPYPQPEDLTAYQILNTPELVFDAERFGIVVDSACMKIPILNNDPRMASLLDEYMEMLATRSGNRVTDKVELIIQDLLSTSDCTLEAVSDLFKVTPRALQHRLQREFTSFHEIVENVRKKTAVSCLRTSSMDLTNIALLLGYSDSSAFSRSFRRWYNQTPSQWRRSNQPLDMR